MRISIVIACYNAETYISQCLDSIFNNTSSQVEVICVDDGSSDNTVSVIESYKNRFSNVLLIKHSENKGTLEARRSGSLVSSGDYIFYIDPDDRILSGSLDKLEYKLDANPVDILCFGFFPIGEESNRFIRYSFGHLNISSKSDILDALFGPQRKMIRSLWVCVWRRKLVLEALEEMPNGYCVYAEDTLMSFIICNKAKKVDFIDAVIYEYRTDSGITASNKTSQWGSIEKQLKSVLYILKLREFILDRYCNKDEIRVYYESFEDLIIQMLASKICNKINGFNNNEIKSDLCLVVGLILFYNEQLWRRRIKLLKPFKIFTFLISLSKHFMGMRQRMAKSNVDKIYYKDLHDQSKVMAKILSSKEDSIW